MYITERMNSKVLAGKVFQRYVIINEIIRMSLKFITTIVNLEMLVDSNKIYIVDLYLHERLNPKQ